jgi:hypothetical protein
MPASNAYMRRYLRRRYYERKLWAISFLGGQCVDCGESDPDVLEFDHSDPNIHPYSPVTHVLRSWSLERLAEFLRAQKITLRCHDCHAEKTSLEMGR